MRKLSDFRIIEIAGTDADYLVFLATYWVILCLVVKHTKIRQILLFLH